MNAAGGSGGAGAAGSSAGGPAGRAGSGGGTQADAAASGDAAADAPDDATDVPPADAHVEADSAWTDAVAPTDSVAPTDVSGQSCPRPTLRDPPDFYPSLAGNCESRLGETCVGAGYCCICREVPSCGYAWTCGFTGGPGCPVDEPTPGAACVFKDIARACNYCPAGQLHSFRCAADDIWVKVTLGCPN